MLLADKTDILRFLILRLRVKRFDANKLYASEVRRVSRQVSRVLYATRSNGLLEYLVVKNLLF